MIIRYCKKIDDLVVITRITVEPGDDDRLWSIMALCDKHFLNITPEQKLQNEIKWQAMLRRKK